MARSLAKLLTGITLLGTLALTPPVFGAMNDTNATESSVTVTCAGEGHGQGLYLWDEGEGSITVTDTPLYETTHLSGVIPCGHYHPDGYFTRSQTYEVSEPGTIFAHNFEDGTLCGSFVPGGEEVNPACAVITVDDFFPQGDHNETWSLDMQVNGLSGPIDFYWNTGDDVTWPWVPGQDSIFHNYSVGDDARIYRVTGAARTDSHQTPDTTLYTVVDGSN